MRPRLTNPSGLVLAIVLTATALAADPDPAATSETATRTRPDGLSFANEYRLPPIEAARALCRAGQPLWCFVYPTSRTIGLPPRPLYYGTYPWDDDPTNDFDDCFATACGGDHAVRWSLG